MSYNDSYTGKLTKSDRTVLASIKAGNRSCMKISEENRLLPLRTPSLHLLSIVTTVYTVGGESPLGFCNIKAGGLGDDIMEYVLNF